MLFIKVRTIKHLNPINFFITTKEICNWFLKFNILTNILFKLTKTAYFICLKKVIKKKHIQETVYIMYLKTMSKNEQ